MMREVGAKSEAGSVHPYEDRILVDGDAGLFCIADGVTISSHGSGAVAAELALKLLRQTFTGDLLSAVKKVNELSLERRKDDRSIGETTLTACFVSDDTLEVANVGDSPAYLVRGGHARSLIVEDRGPGGGITQVIGYRLKVKVHSSRLELEQGDMVVLASDGVGHVLTGPFLAELAENTGAKEASDLIISKARSVPAGYDDDKSAIVIKFLGGEQ